jgi:hypothetical protein
MRVASGLLDAFTALLTAQFSAPENENSQA